MKPVFKTVFTGLIVAGIAGPSVAQVQTLPEVTVISRNYKYLRAVDNKESSQPVKLLERKAAVYDIKNSEYYDEDYENYYITFYLPDGYVLATYDENGKLLQTAERFKNTALPSAVRKAVAKRYPNWAVTDDTYVVKYDELDGAKRKYKMTLKNGDKRIRIKADENGNLD
ncbi:MAG: nicotinate-nucleotide adenylyltransferase [Citrobacter freundii]|nr:MAG: nicotinate-nucleotide adenylyltransferase [Citrobacter freundii]